MNAAARLVQWQNRGCNFCGAKQHRHRRAGRRNIGQLGEIDKPKKTGQCRVVAQVTCLQTKVSAALAR